MMDSYLPIGSVVTLNEAEKRLMIIGCKVFSGEENNEYDYIAIPFPEGYVDSEMFFLFMKNDIAKVDFVGFVNLETQVLLTELNDNE